jgi:hypothetical protein
MKSTMPAYFLAKDLSCLRQMGERGKGNAKIVRCLVNCHYAWEGFGHYTARLVDFRPARSNNNNVQAFAIVVNMPDELVRYESMVSEKTYNQICQ